MNKNNPDNSFVPPARLTKDLIEKADSGDYLASIEMANKYEKGIHVKQDAIKAKYYFDQVYASVEHFKLVMKKLNLSQFRQFEKISVEFEPQVTILVGDNGSGKSTIIDAIAKSLKYLAATIIKENASRSSLDDRDINVDELADIATAINLLAVEDGQYFEHTLSKGKRSKGESNHAPITILGDIYRNFDRVNNQSNLPVIAYYSIDRANEIAVDISKTAEKKAEKLSWSKFDGYADALKNSQNFTNFLAWFILCDKMAKQAEVPLARITQLHDELKTINEDILKADGNLLTYLEKDRQKKQKELSELELSVVNSEAGLCLNMTNQVISAICTFIPEINSISIVHANGGIDMKIEKSGAMISVFQLSQGEKSLLALVGDLAKRMIMLNPSRDNPFDGNGIVLIDEIDLHLHPRWQQQVVSKLLTTFKNIQFILTTHSPQVLSTVHKHNIRVLGNNIYGDAVAAIPIADSYGHPNSDVMHTIMGVEPTPIIAESDILIKYRKLIEQGDLKSEEVANKINKLQLQLNGVLGEQHPDMVRLAMAKRRRERLE
ncbi:AAA family ATPase [Pseudoalteromonas sp. SR43-7]|uniref:AAA family ATPase n=1 Tax=Pseudoalteromonas sp. SR43-7 TaxID=2760939 RepID=UPI0015FDD484|nr:AAA family ATPase [Pseudoalteromonas sp. SR43-7]MBB1329605.1 AAA family ATPase [Pseudoalteromonas sp. SR43-7]